MKKKYFPGLLITLVIITGCASTRQAETYPMSYDQTYQTSLDALDELKAWKVLETDQLGGVIVLEKGGYFMPRRTAKVIVKRVEPFKTRVELYETSLGQTHKDFFEAIDRHVQNRASTYTS
ncbi:MAG: hypothetical protein KBC91_00095 [Candidatus Omnitrophica bacterium]|nr:hypothetical protein [Candidatus Omnitrophota bacterium]